MVEMQMPHFLFEIERERRIRKLKSFNVTDSRKDNNEDDELTKNEEKLKVFFLRKFLSKIILLVDFQNNAIVCLG